MREILFRGQRKSDKKWIYGNLLRTDDGVFIIQNHVPNHRLQNYEVSSETVCQYTGLTDKDGRKIFEGDIVKDTSLHTIGKVFYWEYEGRFAFDDVNDDAQFYTGDMWEDCEIIGNIFDNPELLN